jgi:uncharacterized OB-fold protein
MTPRPLPDRDSRAWWDALSHHQLLLQACGSCGRLRWPARVICGACGSFESDWKAATGRATVASWIVNHHQFGEAFPSPYTVVTARLHDQEDILVPGGYGGPSDGSGLLIGAEISVDFEDLVEGGESWTLLRWRLAGPVTAP